MTEKDFSITADFPSISAEAWRALAEKELRGASVENRLRVRIPDGATFPALGLAGPRTTTAPPGEPPYTRGSRPLGNVLGRDLCQEVSAGTPEEANRAILDDLAGGVTSIRFRCRVTRKGKAPGSIPTAVLLGEAEDLETVLRGVPLDSIGIQLDAGKDVEQITAWLPTVAEKLGVDPAGLKGSLGADPIGIGARLEPPQDDGATWHEPVARLSGSCRDRHPSLTAIRVESRPYHDAGATDSQELAFILATAVEYLRVLETHGFSIDEAARQITFGLSVDCRLFPSMAKLRAARWLWGRVVSACGVEGDPAAMVLHVRPSLRVFTRRDPWTSVLRNTACCFVAALGGADRITSLPHDHLLGPPDAFSRRLARNTPIVLGEEAHLERIVDPAGGSYTVEAITEELARLAWTTFQEIESRGGMTAALRDGHVAGLVEAARDERREAVAHGRTPIVGVTAFPDLEDAPIAEPDRTPAGKGSFPLYRDAEPYERFRDRSDRKKTNTGSRPVVLAARLGPAAGNAAAFSLVKNVFGSGGFEVVDWQEAGDESLADAITRHGARLAVLCPGPETETGRISDAAAEVASSSAARVLLATPGEDEAKSRDIDGVVHPGCDFLALLEEAWSLEDDS